MASFKLSDEQQAAVDSKSPSLCILACAGSGKTTALTNRIAKLVDHNGADPSSIVAITFTVLAGDKLKYELSRVLKDRSATSKMFVGTIHSFCYHLLSDLKVFPGEGVEPITESQQFILFSKFWTEWEIQKVRPELKRTPIFEQLIKTFDIIKMNDVNLESLLESTPDVARLFKLYNQYLAENGFIDYGDMLIKARDILKNSVDQKLESLKKYRFLFIDEYQDVDPVQAEIFDLLKKDAEICVVGDDDQAIYQFRGADERNIQNFSKSGGCKNLPLSENRRCPRNILSVSENNIMKVSTRLSKTMFTKVPSGLMTIRQFETIDQELSFIVDTIKQLVSENELTSLGQVGILLRSMSSYGAQYVDALRADGIKCIARGGHTLFSTEEIKKLTGIIEWFAKENDDIKNLVELSPVFTIPIDVMVLKSRDNLSLLIESDFFAAGLTSQDWALFCKLKILHIKYDERKFGSLLELVHGFIEILDLFNPRIDDFVKYNVAQFTRIIAEYEKIQDNKSFRSLAAFLVAYAQNTYDESLPLENKADAVNVLTVHQSKGLEFDFVFLPMLVEKRFPLEQNQKNWLLEDDLFDFRRYLPTLDNERRLFYVASTRARKALFLLASKDVGLRRFKIPSVFWSESKKVTLLDPNILPVRPNKVQDDQTFLVAGYSSLEYYLTCPYRYQFTVEFGLEFPQSVFFQFGKLMHDILAYVNNSSLVGKKITEGQAKEYLLTNFNLYYKNTSMRNYDIQKQKLRANNIIETYFKDKTEWIDNVVGIEGELNYSMPRALIKGRYDALVKNQRGKYTIVDYKTGHPHPNLRTDFQMQFYSLAINSQTSFEVDQAVVYYIEVNRTSEFTVTPEFLSNGITNLNSTVDGILSKKFSPNPRKDLCAQCEVNRLCSYKA